VAASSGWRKTWPAFIRAAHGPKLLALESEARAPSRTAISCGVTVKPSRARAMAGARSCFQVSLPNRRCASARPFTVPGTPTARLPAMLRLGSGSPSAFRYMSALAAPGAVSR
jgi:hypothetical protein